jgi:hypothetical protein
MCAMSAMPQVRHGRRSTTWTMTVRVALTVIVVLGLAVDAYVHLHLASDYDAVKTSTLSQGELFRAEAVIAILAGVALLVRPRRYTAAIAFLVAAGGLGVVLLYRYVDVKGFGPIPSMYEPVWYAEKTRSAIAEGVAAVAALALVLVPRS